MRIASYYPDIRMVGRNDGGPLYHTNCLRRLFGAENVSHLFQSDDLADTGEFDLHYWVDHGEDALGLTKFTCPKPNVYISSDTHLGYDYRLAKAREFDWVFCNQKRAVEEFVRDGIPADRCFWLPHAFDPLAYSPGVFNANKNDWDTETAILKKWDVCFIGNLNDKDRVDHLDRLFKEFPNFYWCTRRFHEAAEIFNKSRIVFNVSCRDDVNMRIFEALGSGAFLLTNEIPTLGDLFKDGVHLATYRNMDDMIDKMHHYLNHEREREEIARAGYLAVSAMHTYMHRVLTVLDVIGIEYDHDKAANLLPTMPDVANIGVPV